ncbi:hypothetical protein ANTHELSMS3_01146 [Antarctobacter heliothermus]|uniref:Uncharacterized protein n=1 Tax=Antarctobacter heliothermus TaxID=74033 RepID=A0A222E1M8_9RHOB|nr:hypothetical protein [Antarctobacter heliothermus]ASP19861.1 hypothetical protein ANTHELSMS3_01146 [Antarctobacter heliothermus]
MPLTVLLALVVVGIAGVALLIHTTGLSQPRRFTTEAEARAAWTREFPLTDITGVTLCRSGRAALIATPTGTGVVWPMGADSTARWVADGRVTRRDGGLTLYLPDYVAPTVRLHLDPDEIALWAERIGTT